MTINNNTPGIRFSNFNRNWLKKNIDDILTEERRPIVLIDDETYELVTVRRRNQGVVSRGFLNGREILVKNYSVVKTGDYIISKRQVVHGANGFVPSFLNNAIVSNEYLIAVENEYITTRFWSLVSKTEKMYKTFLLSSYGVDIEKMVFDVEDWRKRRIFIPSKLEQDTISNLFQYLDEFIALHIRKYNQTQNFKRAMLTQMFPKEGKSTPEIRLKEFSANWTEKTLDDCFTERTERSELGELISVTINSGVVKATELKRKDNSSKDKSNYKKVEIDDIAYNSMRMWQGASGVSKYAGILSPAYTVLTPKQNYSSLFFSYYFKLPQMLMVFQVNSQGLTSDTWNLKFPTLKRIAITLPSIEEQIAIGNFFIAIDRTVKLQMKQIEILESLKKALLSKMFI